MSDETIPISILRCEPNPVSNEDCSSTYYQPGTSYTFWRIFVDDKLITDTAHPFKVCFDTLELFGDPCYPIWGYGEGYIGVRCEDRYILWFGEEAVHYDWDNCLPSKRIFVFDAAQYSKAIEDAIRQETSLVKDRFAKGISHRFSKFLSDTFFHAPTNILAQQPTNPPPPETVWDLPKLTPDELTSVLEPHFPQPDESMYRYPERSDDPLGAKLLRKVRAILYISRKHIAEPYRLVYEAELQNKFRNGEIGAVRVCEPPPTWTELRIGLELETSFDECIWRVGKTGQGVAIQFLAKPYFPLWLCGEALDQAFADEHFLQD